MSGRYASYWNAFLFIDMIVRTFANRMSTVDAWKVNDVKHAKTYVGVPPYLECWTPGPATEHSEGNKRNE